MTLIDEIQADHITAELQAASERVQAKVQAALGQVGDAKP